MQLRPRGQQLAELLHQRFALERLRIDRRLQCQRMIAWQDDDYRFVRNHLVEDIGLGLNAQETKVYLAVLQSLGKIG